MICYWNKKEGYFKIKFFKINIYFSSCNLSKKSAKSKKNKKIHLYERNHGKCEKCKQFFNIDILQIHHKKPVALYPELKSEISNWMLVCPECHQEIHKQVTIKAYELLAEEL